MTSSLQWFPLLPGAFYLLLAVAAFAVLALAYFRKVRAFYLRGLFLLLLAVILFNPVLIREKGQLLPDKVIVVLDDSGSQKIGGRDKFAEAALEKIKKSLPTETEAIILRAGSAGASAGKGQNTALFAPLREQMMAFPRGQIAATIFITDGQVHDVPPDVGVFEGLAPFHLVLTGKKDEFDRKVTIVSAPKYGVLDQEMSITVRVDEFGKKSGGVLTVSARQDGVLAQEKDVMPGQEAVFNFSLRHTGQNVFEFSVPVEEGELTASNNTAPVIVNAVRDRLSVLLVSGAPHMGERAWRNLLKSDPSIDLVHFTILRSPMSMDATPQNEMALIVFPVDELFEKKIRDFDLIIFDRYQQYGLLQPQYFENIASFIRDGGAFLMAMGTDQATESVFSTSLGDLLPVTPRGESILKGAYRPEITEKGKVHPVTADLARAEGKKPWGSWFSTVDINAPRGETVLSGPDQRPLLVLDKVGKGRVGVLASDNIWLWSKSANESGPYNELLRNMAHWLMKEPELEDDFIKATAKDSRIDVSVRDIGSAEDKNVLMTRPSGATESVVLSSKDKGWVKANVDAAETGVYSFERGTRKVFVVVGGIHNEEFADVHTTAEKMAPIVEQTKGGIVWFQDTPDIELRAVNAGARRMGGDSWIGLKKNKAYAVNSLDTVPLIPAWAGLSLILLGLLAVWRREGGKKGD